MKIGCFPKLGSCKLKGYVQYEGAFSFQITPGKVSAPFTAWAEGTRAPPLLPQDTVAQKEALHQLKRPTSTPLPADEGWLGE